MFDPQIQAVMDQVDALRDQVEDHWQIPREAARLLAQLARLGYCRSICEIGTSYGFSTLHLAAAAAELGGHVYAAELDPRKVQLTRQHLEEAGLSGHATIVEGDAAQVINRMQPDRPFDLVFIDAVKAECFDYLNAVWPKLADATALATDNAITHPQALSDFLAHLRALPGFTSDTIAVGNGIELTIRRPVR
jgi:predicted O-methyltransferase YrrM